MPRWTSRLSGTTKDHSGKTVLALRTNSQLGTADIGAPLIDTGGKVIGWVGPIPYIAFNDENGDHSSSVAGSAMAVGYLQDALSNMGQFNGGRKVWLDLYGDTVDPENAKALGCPVSHGVLVEIVDPEGPAARAGIRGGTRVKMVDRGIPNGAPWQFLTGGDVIVAIDGKAVRSQDDFNKIIHGCKPGELVMVTLYRGHRLLTVKVRVTAYPYTPTTG